MVAYNFQKRFVAPIRAGTKRQTIRAERAGRSRHARPGEAVQLYFGLRTKQSRLIAAPICASVWPIRIDLDRGVVFCNDGWIRMPEDLDAFAVEDGFADWGDLCRFWAAQHPGMLAFSGVLIRWEPIAAFPEAVRSLGGGGQLDLFGREVSP